MSNGSTKTRGIKMSKKTTDRGAEKQAEAKKPVVLNDDELDRIDGGAISVDGIGKLDTTKVSTGDGRFELAGPDALKIPNIEDGIIDR